MVAAVHNTTITPQKGFISSSLDTLACKVKSLMHLIVKIGQHLASLTSFVFVFGAVSTFISAGATPLVFGLTASAVASFGISSLLKHVRQNFGIIKNPKYLAADLGLLKDTKMVKPLTEEIFPLYIKHEKTFDGHQIHGRMHISRCIIYTMAMLNFYKRHKKANVDELASIYSIAFHDAGRRGNGVDVWEKDSQKLLYNFLRDKGYGLLKALKFSRIVNKETKSDSLEARAILSSDCLDIMRCRLGGIKSFRRNLLTFLNPAKDKAPSGLTKDECKNIREKLIQEAWQFIKMTENKKVELTNSKTYFEDVLYLLESNQKKFPTLFDYLKK